MTIIKIDRVLDIPKKIKYKDEVYSMFTSGMNKNNLEILMKNNKGKIPGQGTMFMVLKTYEVQGTRKFRIYALYSKFHYSYLVK